MGLKGRALRELQDSDFPNYGTPIPLQSNFILVNVETGWQVAQQLEVRQSYPFPAMVLGLVAEVQG